MKKMLSVVLFLFSFAVNANDVTIEFNGGELRCNLGQIAADNSDTQGEHSSDPSGDGKGKNDPDHDRVGLANILNRGDLEATCEFIACALYGEFCPDP